jgi:predicted MPP superfamily phosphohydrolase
MENRLQQFDMDENAYTILLSHRPELFEVYTEFNIDLVFTGHAHGGQFRLPLIGGLYAPNQGLLPEYDSGLYSNANMNMLVSRGIGNSSFPIRFNNRPEVILVELKTS